jgi:hypothetical protein
MRDRGHLDARIPFASIRAWHHHPAATISHRIKESLFVGCQIHHQILPILRESIGTNPSSWSSLERDTRSGTFFPMSSARVVLITLPEYRSRSQLQSTDYFSALWVLMFFLDDHISPPIDRMNYVLPSERYFGRTASFIAREQLVVQKPHILRRTQQVPPFQKIRVR